MKETYLWTGCQTNNLSEVNSNLIYTIDTLRMCASTEAERNLATDSGLIRGGLDFFSPTFSPTVYSVTLK